jgi:hypothetical protein
LDKIELVMDVFVATALRAVPKHGNNSLHAR